MIKCVMVFLVMASTAWSDALDDKIAELQEDKRYRSNASAILRELNRKQFDLVTTTNLVEKLPGQLTLERDAFKDIQALANAIFPSASNPVGQLKLLRPAQVNAAIDSRLDAMPSRNVADLKKQIELLRLGYRVEAHIQRLESRGLDWKQKGFNSPRFRLVNESFTLNWWEKNLPASTNRVALIKSKM